MAVSAVDAIIETAALTKSRRNVRVYQPIVFRRADGSAVEIAKAVVDERVAAQLQPGNSGRYYLFHAVDHRGVHGVRDGAGHAIFAYPRNNETAMMVVALLGIAMSAILLAIGRISFWALFCIALGVPFYFVYRSTRLEAQRQFEADNPR